MRFAYLGNFGPEHSTENHLRRALQHLGHEVTPIQESGLDWSRVPNLALGHDYFMWTRTAGFDPGDLTTQQRALNEVGERMPTIGYHLDRWAGLNRSLDVDRSPFFRVQFLFTADGGHPEFWRDRGINHWWMPPGVLGLDCELGVYRRNLAADVGFVGSLRNYGHVEWAGYRRALGDYLRRHYGHRFRVWESGVRGRQLADVYASVKVLVGDSCLAGDSPVKLPGGVRGGAAYYWSDRIPETLGRGGYLLHPYVAGLELHHPALPMFPLGDFGRLKRQIDAALADEPLRRVVAEVNRDHVLANHTYERRMTTMLGVVNGTVR